MAQVCAREDKGAQVCARADEVTKACAKEEEVAQACVDQGAGMNGFAWGCAVVEKGEGICRQWCGNVRACAGMCTCAGMHRHVRACMGMHNHGQGQGHL